MKPRSLIVLALVVAGLAAFIAFYERELPSSDERRERQDLVLDVEAAEVDAVIVDRSGEKTVELRRSEADDEAQEADDRGEETASAPEPASSSWRLVRPFAFRAAAADVDGLVSALADLRHERVMESFDPEQLGLAEPRARVTLKLRDRTVTLRVGADIPAYSSIAVQLEGRPRAYAVGDALWDQLAKEPGEWRSRQVVPASRTAIQRIAWRIDDVRFALARRDGELRVVAPYEDLADETRVEELLTALTSLQVDRFLAADAPAVEDGPERTLRLRLEGRREPFELAIAETGDDGALRLDYEGQAAIAAESELLDRLSGPAAAWRSRRWSSLDTWEVERATLRDADGAVTLARTDGTWTRDGEEIPLNAVTDLLDALLQIEAETVRPRAESWAPPADPILEIELQTENGAPETLTLYPDAAATTSTRQVLLDLPPDTGDRLHQRLVDVRTAEPVAPPEPSEPEQASDETSEDP